MTWQHHQPDDEQPRPARTPRRISVAEQLYRAGHGRRTDADLHICPCCASELVQPTRWAPVDNRRWRVELDCPECPWQSAGVYPQHVLDRFDAILDDGVAAITDDLDRLERSNMQEEVNRFLDALAADRILPEDF